VRVYRGQLLPLMVVSYCACVYSSCIALPHQQLSPWTPVTALTIHTPLRASKQFIFQLEKRFFHLRTSMQL
jgi:hypothetical protein